ncbi:MAG: hypothetical protein U0K19_02250 [Bifidobacteriaceae bacterium]|nr:hypothetical protein [Bifidobacteriaceae bacterium]
MRSMMRKTLLGSLSIGLCLSLAACGNLGSRTVSASSAFASDQQTIWFTSNYPPGPNVAINNVLVFQGGKVTCYDTSGQATSPSLSSSSTTPNSSSAAGTQPQSDSDGAEQSDSPTASAILTYGDLKGLDTQQIVAKAQSADHHHFRSAIAADVQLYQIDVQQAKSDIVTSRQSLSNTDTAGNHVARGNEIDNANLVISNDEAVIAQLQKTPYQAPTAVPYTLGQKSSSDGTVATQTLSFDYTGAPIGGNVPNDSCVLNSDCRASAGTPYQKISFSRQLSAAPGTSTVNGTKYSGYQTGSGSTIGYLQTASSDNFVLG